MSRCDSHTHSLLKRKMIIDLPAVCFFSAVVVLTQPPPRQPGSDSDEDDARSTTLSQRYLIE